MTFLKPLTFDVCTLFSSKCNTQFKRPDYLHKELFCQAMKVPPLSPHELLVQVLCALSDGKKWRVKWYIFDKWWFVAWLNTSISKSRWALKFHDTKMKKKQADWMWMMPIFLFQGNSEVVEDVLSEPQRVCQRIFVSIFLFLRAKTCDMAIKFALPRSFGNTRQN